MQLQPGTQLLILVKSSAAMQACRQLLRCAKQNQGVIRQNRKEQTATAIIEAT
jgi:hypothetical protein